MVDSETPASSDESSDDSRLIEQIVEGFVAKLQSGQAGELDKLLAEHPALAGVLKRRLTLIEDMFRVAQSSRLMRTDADPGSLRTQPLHRHRPAGEHAKHLDCPHCGNALQIVDEASYEITCRVCGSTVHLEPGKTEGYRGPETAEQYGRFAVIEVVGRGGFGVVFRARDTELNRIVALKVPRAGYFVSSEEEGRFAREARNTARLRHPGIVPVLEVGRDHGLPFIVSEFIDGMTLADLVLTQKLQHRETAEIILAVCEAIHYAHQQKVIHRDIKPSNILLDHDHRPYVTDFGLARGDEGEFTVTVDGQVLGTPAYMSPEQAAGDQEQVTALSDVYSLGVVLYRLLCSELPFRGSKRMMIHQVMHEEPRVPRRINEYVPRDLETITLKAISKTPGRRYPSAQAMADDLRRWLRGEPILARPVSRFERLVRWSRRNRLVASLLASVFSLLICFSIGATWWAYREHLLRREVQVAESHALEQLTRLTLNNGVSHINSGHYLRALPWLVAALELESDQPERVAVHRRRLGVLRDHSPRLIGVYIGDLRVVDAQYSPDAQRAVIGFRSGKAAVVDAQTGSPVTEIEHLDAITDVAFAPSSDVIVTASLDGRAEVRRAATGQRLRSVLQHTGAVHHAAFSPDGTRIVTAGNDLRALVWNATTDGEPLRELLHEMPVKWAEYTPDGRFIVTIAWKTSQVRCTVNVWDSQTGDRVGQPMVHADVVSTAAISPDGNLLITPCWDGAARIWDLESGDAVSPPLLHECRVVAATFSVDGSLALTASEDGRIRSWDPASGASHELIIQSNELFAAAAFDTTGRFVTTSGLDGNARVWQLTAARPIGPPLPHTAAIEGIRLADSGRYAMSYDNNGVVKFWDNLTASMTTRTLQHADEVRKFRFSSTGRTLVSGGLDRVARIWDVPSGRQIGEAMQHVQMVLDVAISPDDQLLATASVDNTARIWDAHNGEPISEPLEHDGWVKKIRFNPQGTKLATACADSKAYVWDVASGKLDFRLSHADQITWVEFSPDGKWIGTCSRDKLAKIWTVQGRHVATLEHAETVMKCRFDHVGSRVLTASHDDTAVVWQLPAGTRIGEPMQLSASVWDATFSPDGRHVVTSDFNGVATIWNVLDAPRQLGIFKTYGNFAKESRFSASGQMVLTRSGLPSSGGPGQGKPDGALQIWDPLTRDPITPPLFHFDGDVEDAWFSPDEDMVATAGEDGTIRFWQLATDNRPLDQLKLHAEILAEHRLDVDGNEVALEPIKLMQACTLLRAATPAEFQATAADRTAWERFLEATPPLTRVKTATEPP